MYTLVSDLGDDGIALIQWAINCQLSEAVVLYVDTGWQSRHWQQRIRAVQQWCSRYELPMHILPPQADFSRLVREHGQFPSRRFQWCAGMLKGLPLIDWLETHDEDQQAVVVLPNRRDMALATAMLNEYIYESEYYNERDIWLPLVACTRRERDTLIAQSPFAVSGEPAGSCFPCIYSQSRHLGQLAGQDLQRVQALEHQTGTTMFEHPIETIRNQAQQHPSSGDACRNYYEPYADGCSWYYGCGL